MFRAGDIFKTIVHAQQEDRNVYLNVADQNLHGASAESQAHSITTLLYKTNTRSIGLRFLIKYLNQCPSHILKDKGNVWLTIIIRTCNSKEIGLYGELIYEAVALLVIQIQAAPETAKWFGSNCLGKVYESLSFLNNKTTICCTIASLKAVKQCLKYYPGPSKSGKLAVTRYLLTLMDSCNPEVVYESGNCWLQLQQVRGNSTNANHSNDKVQWQEFQLGLLCNLNELLNDAFPKYKDNTKDFENHKLQHFHLELQGDPIKRAAQVCTRFCNLTEFLKIALSQPYPSKKLICAKRILGLIQHGLAVNYGNCENIDSMCFENLLPHMHTKLLELLEVLMNICHTHLRPHFRLMSSIVLDSLQKTMWSTPEGLSVQLFNLRIQVYKATTSWLTTFAEGSGCDLIAERLVKILLEDVIIRRRDIYLVSATQSKNKSKRKRTAMSEASESPFQSELLINKNKELLCKQALQCLQQVLDSVGFLLKPQLLRNMLSTILENSAQIYEKRAWKENVYNEWTCRLELYKTLFTFIKLRNIPCPPPSEIVLTILEESSKKDPNSDIRICCKNMIASAEKTLHPQRESLIFKKDDQQSTSTIQINGNTNYEIASDIQQSTDNNENTQLKEAVPSTTVIPLDNLNEETPSAPVSKRIRTSSESKDNTKCKDNTTKNKVIEEEALESPASNNPVILPKADVKEPLEKIVEAPRINNPVLTKNICAKESTKVSSDTKHSTPENISTESKPSKSDDDDYIAELQAAFVDELK
ncbi:proline-, glutamic acid- and leucine-rich protein 1 isoform X1 [Drosophila mojavensis]|uniref:Pre-rRNA-processing protein RIX1 N-terminal domain-containing protein n=1 Tax=Drosophila mojavensis TaxID=7230 RepID=B4K4F3_DROMO|nr:proline-, glutamic acid- and leucine-rich protein 1 isoform X1 [Drosophila mojavensis]EDW13905.2 uncharacterized protein Dmoj_GI23627 [Drosophila mojavensis]